MKYIIALFIMGELNELQRQNSYLENTMKQSFRPLGVAAYSDDLNKRQIIITYLGVAKPGKFTFKCTPRLYNRGKGVLSYLGAIWHISAVEIPFRKEFLDGQLTDVTFDGRYSYARRTPVQPDQFLETLVMCENKEFLEKYFLYILYLYEDQEGALYDTEHLDVLAFAPKPRIKDSILYPILTEDSFNKELYHRYSAQDKRMLIEVIRKLGHPLGDVISINQ